MSQQTYEIGDLVEVVNVSSDKRRPAVFGGRKHTAEVGDRGIVVAMYATDFRVVSGKRACADWEANCSAAEVKLVERLGKVEAQRRLFEI